MSHPARGAQPWGCMPAILGAVLPQTGRAEQLSCLAAPERRSGQWVPPGLGCLKGYTPSAFSIPRSPLGFSALAGVTQHRPWLLGSPTSSSSPATASALAGWWQRRLN